MTSKSLQNRTNVESDGYYRYNQSLMRCQEWSVYVKPFGGHFQDKDFLEFVLFAELNELQTQDKETVFIKGNELQSYLARIAMTRQ
jgi:hypothetical protein